MKFSKYNIIHTTENQEHILFNSLWGSTFVISPSVKQADIVSCFGSGCCSLQGTSTQIGCGRRSAS